MMLITKELAKAVVEFHYDHDTGQCQGCGAGLIIAERKYDENDELIHEPNCIVVRAKLLLEREWPNDRPFAGKGA